MLYVDKERRIYLKEYFKDVPAMKDLDPYYDLDSKDYENDDIPEDILNHDLDLMDQWDDFDVMAIAHENRLAHGPITEEDMKRLKVENPHLTEEDFKDFSVSDWEDLWEETEWVRLDEERDAIVEAAWREEHPEEAAAMETIHNIDDSMFEVMAAEGEKVLKAVEADRKKHLNDPEREKVHDEMLEKWKDDPLAVAFIQNSKDSGGSHIGLEEDIEYFMGSPEQRKFVEERLKALGKI